MCCHAGSSPVWWVRVYCTADFSVGGSNLVLQSQIRQAPFVVAFLGSGLVAPSPP